ANCLLILTLTPTVSTARTATVTITNRPPPSPPLFPYTTLFRSPPTATLSATSSAFGNQRVGTTSAAQNLTLTNNGGTPLNLTSNIRRAHHSTHFTCTARNPSPTGTGSVAPGASCTISISFTPVA